MGTKLEECARAAKDAVAALLAQDEFASLEAREIVRVRAVIRCLMEPSDKMLMIGSAALVETMRSSRELGESECFRAMLQSVLDEAGKE